MTAGAAALRPLATRTSVRRSALCSLFFFVLLGTAFGKKEEKEKPPPKVLEADAPVQTSGELDAMQKVLNSPQMEGKKFGKREIAADGKSGRIFLEPEDGQEQEQWSPQFQVSLHELRKRVETEDLVLAYFFSSEKNELGLSHDNGKKFEAAARELIEGEDEISLVLVDLEKHRGRDEDLLREYGVFKPHTYKLFVNGKPSPYRGSHETQGIVWFMNDKAGRATTKVETSEALDAVLADASWTIVVGVFGPAYQGASSRELFAEAARELRESGRLSFVEVSTKVANGAARFAKETTPFDTATSVYAVVRSPKWLGKTETPYFTSTDFRKMHSCAVARGGNGGEERAERRGRGVGGSDGARASLRALSSSCTSQSRVPTAMLLALPFMSLSTPRVWTGSSRRIAGRRSPHSLTAS